MPLALRVQQTVNKCTSWIYRTILESNLGKHLALKENWCFHWTMQFYECHQGQKETWTWSCYYSDHQLVQKLPHLLYNALLNITLIDFKWKAQTIHAMLQTRGKMDLLVSEPEVCICYLRGLLYRSSFSSYC